jgi:hypothetical protein
MEGRAMRELDFSTEPQPAENGLIRLSSNVTDRDHCFLPTWVLQEAQALALANGVTLTEQLRKAIDTELWLHRIKVTHKLLQQDRSSGVIEVIFE